MSEAIITLSDANFEEEIINSETSALVDLWAPWCAPCRMIAPAIEELADEYQGKVVIGKLNIDENFHHLLPRLQSMRHPQGLLNSLVDSLLERLSQVPLG